MHQCHQNNKKGLGEIKYEQNRQNFFPGLKKK